jgi:nitrate/nitrite-specific signal transduction histidine kinase
MLFGIRWGSLRTKIIAWSFVPTAIILGAVAVVIFYAYQDVTEDLVIGRNRELVRLTASQLSAELKKYVDLLEAEARTSDIYGNDLVAQSDALRRASNRLADFDAGVLILDTFGTVVATEPERPEALGQDWSDRACYREVLRSQVAGEPGSVFSNVVTDGPQGAEVVCIAVPISGEQGEFIGTMVGMFRLGATAVSAFYGDIVELRTGESGSAHLVDGDGRVIYHSDTQRIGEDFSHQEVVQQVLSGQVNATRTRDLENRDIVASFAPVPGTPWGLVTEESWTALISASQGYRRSLLLLLVLGVVVPALVVAVAVRRITHPITELIAAAQEVAGGNFGQTITARTGDEIEELAKQFNLMSAELQESYAHLEQRVADRTKELAALNAIAATVSQSLDIAEILDHALDKTLEVIGIEAGGIYLLDEEANVLTIAAQRGFSPQFAAAVDKLKVGEGFSGRVVQSGQPLVVKDISADPRLTRMVVREEGLRSVAIVPLSSKGRVPGTLFTITRGYREFTDQDVQLLSSIGHQIGVAVENARLFDAEQRRAEQFRVINEVGRHIVSILDVDELLLEIVRLLKETFGYYLVIIGLIEGDELIFKAGAKTHWDDRQFQAPSVKVGGRGITAWVAATGEPLLAPDVSQEPRFLFHPDSAETRSELAVPLKTKSAVIGVLNVESDQLNAFDESDLAVLQSLANQAAIAIENARLYEDTKNRLAQLAALQETTSAVASTLELDRLLDLIIQQATTLLQGEGGIINLVDWGENEDEVAAACGSLVPTVGIRAPLETSLSGWVTLHNQPVISNQIPQDSRVHASWRSGAVEGTKGQVSAQSAVVAPLAIKDQVMGTLVVADKQEGRGEFDQADLDILVAFANQAATAIENARLYEQAQQLAVVEERQRLARELHDAVTQTLFSASLIAEALPEIWEGDQDEGRQLLAELRRLSRGALAEMRTLLMELRPAALAEASLDDLLRQLGEAVAGRIGVPVTVTVEGECELSPDVHVALYRIAQEALNNVVKHANASQVTVSLRCSPPASGEEKGRAVELLVSDDGYGFDPRRIEAECLGLEIMRERAGAIGATLTIESEIGHGTEVMARWTEVPERSDDG